MTNLTHAAWDDGAITDMFKGTGGFMEQKTVKTRCGKRVATKHVDNAAVTCPACVAEIRREAAAHEQLKELAESYGISLDRDRARLAKPAERV